MSYRVSRDDDTSRKVIDRAIESWSAARLLPDEASPSCAGVHRTGVRIGSLAGALVALAGGNSGCDAQHIGGVQCVGLS